MSGDTFNPDAAAPSSLGAELLSWLPAPVQAALKWLLALAGWLGVVNSSLSILERLRWVGTFSEWLLSLSGALRATLLTLWEPVHDCLEVWRTLTAPVRELLLNWVPVDIRDLMLDGVVIISIILIAIIRQELRLAKLRRAVVADLRVHQEGMYNAAGTAPEESYEIAMEAGARRVENLIMLVQRSRSARHIREAVLSAENSEQMIHKNRWGAAKRSALVMGEAVRSVNRLFLTSVALGIFLALAVALDAVFARFSL